MVQPLSSRWIVRLRFERIFTEVKNCWKERGYCRGSRQRIVEGSSRKSKDAATAKQVNSSSSRSSVDRPGRPPAVVGVRSTGAVDRRAQHAQGISGRPVRSTAGGPPGRPSGRPTKVTQLSVGNGRPARSTGAWGRSTGRSTDSRVCYFSERVILDPI